MESVKIVAFLFLMTATISMASPQMFSPLTTRAGAVDEKLKSNPKPEIANIDRFDRAIQQRFLTQPFLGINRITPPFPPNPHLREFYPQNEEESNSVTHFMNNGWKVDLYLFGRRAQPKVVEGKQQNKFTINYRLNKPVTVTTDLKQSNLPAAKRLLNQVKVAFQEFQTPNSPNESSYEFSIGKWAYVARPVRASNESCLKCHSDYVITSTVANNQYTFRRRRVGDVNGVIVYGFSKTQ